jgi:cytochrome P450
MSSETVSLPEPRISGDRIPGPGILESWRFVLTWGEDRITPVATLHERYGDVVRLNLGNLVIFLTLRPDLAHDCLVSKHKDFHKDRYYFFLKLILGHGLLTSEEDFHLRQRRMIQPAFHRERIAAYGEAMTHFSKQMRTQWQDGQEVDIYSAMGKLALDIVAKTLFNSDVSDEAERVAHILDTVLSMDAQFVSPIGKILSKLPLPATRRFYAAIAQLDEILYRMIREHRASGDQGDLLSMLLMAQDEDDGKGMSDKQVRDEATTLFLAGHETTAIALTWTWYLLSQNPEVEARMHEEIDRVLEGRDPSAADYNNLSYTYRVFKESMRLFPPAYMIGREAIRDTEVGPYSLRKGEIMVMSQYLIHRSPKYYTDPERFDPDRWLPENCEGLPKFAYFPFGGGRRLCVGEPFAWMEGVLVIATLAQKWRFELKPGHQIGLNPSVTLRPKGGMPMIAHAR